MSNLGHPATVPVRLEADRSRLGARSRWLRRISVEARWVWAAVLVFVLVTFWWLTQDDRVPDFDSGEHLILSLVVHSEVATGHLTAPFTDYNTYPPLVHVLGGASIFLFGIHPMAMILTSNLVFVPLLAFGCFGVGRIAFGPRAGLLAAAVALGAPMFVSMMHEYDLDPPQAAMVAVSLYALLASRRFERPWVAGVAGVLSGLALLTKETSVIFLGAPAIVAVLRGGWRRPLGLLAFAAGLGVVAGPWYAYHLHDLTSTANSIGGLAPSPLQAPPRWSLQNLGWYFWDLVNEQVMAPLALAFVIGVVFAVRQCLRRPLAAENVLPELLAGALVSYLGMTYLTHKDPRYTLPMLVYVAVLATGWIAAIARPRLRTALTAAVVALAAINAFGVSTGIGGPVRIALPGAKNTIIFQRQLTLYANVGWIRGGPQRDGDAQALVRGLYKAGIRKVEFDPSVNALDFNSQGLVFLAAAAGMVSPPTFVNEPDNAFVIRRAVRRGDPPPCQRLNDGSGIYVIQGNAGGINPRKLRNPANPRQRFTLLCPGRGRVLFP